MATQAAQIAATVASMKRVIKSRHYLSDSDDEPTLPTNRGNKLKRKAEFFHEGELGGRRPYKRKIEHAGYIRSIVGQKPRRYDEYGEELGDNEDESEADADAEGRNPYRGIHIEKLLGPLVAASDLLNHPALSIPYNSKVLPDMVQQACEMVHRERATLVQFKQLLVKFRGDPSWISCGDVSAREDASLFPASIEDGIITTATGMLPLDSFLALHNPEAIAEGAHNTHHKPNRHAVTINGFPLDGEGPGQDYSDRNSSSKETNVDTTKQASTEVNYTKIKQGLKHKDGSLSPQPKREGSAVPQSGVLADATSGLDSGMRDEPMVKGGTDMEVVDRNGNTPTSQAEAADSTETSRPAQRMRTRAQAQAVSTRSSATLSPSPESSQPPFIHPLYLVPATAIADRDFALPPPEAEETRRILMAWVQKQEEVVRGVERLYLGLLKAERLRKTVRSWCKAEGHVGEMSDGEDWYDGEEWGLDGELKKGAAEEEEDVIDKGKKTRGRRGAQ